MHHPPDDPRRPQEETPTAFVDTYVGRPPSPGTDAYMSTMAELQAALGERNYKLVAEHVHRNLEQIKPFIQEWSRDFGAFEIGSIPALQQGGTALALIGDRNGLDRVRALVASTPELSRWQEYVRKHEKDMELVPRILQAVEANPNCLQTDLKHLLGETDGRSIARLVSYLEKAGKLNRIRAGRTHRILPGRSPHPRPTIRPTVKSHRANAAPFPPTELSVSDLPYVPLPRSPKSWGDVQASRKTRQVSEPDDHFEVRDASWRLGSVETIPMADRPDPAFRRLHPTNTGLFMLDDLGNAEGLEEAPAAALRYDRRGRVAIMRPLDHGVYRLGVHPMGGGLIAMSKDCILHTYDDGLAPKLQTTLADAPEVLELRRRLDLPGGDSLKNYIRCVALSQKGGRYLFTAVDEAWCVDVAGSALWGARLPLADGWERAAPSQNEYGTSDEVGHALGIMGLDLPLSAEDLKRRYRRLAKQWHPDLNPGSLVASEKMKELTGAASLLTGLEESALSEYGRAAYRRTESREIEIRGQHVVTNVEYRVGEVRAADWIYAAGFAAQSDSVYLAGYSGRVIRVNAQGEGDKAYDIGSVPHRIVDTGDYLYLLTSTRLYVLRDDVLHALIDVSDGGDLLVAQSGFGLLEKKRLRWFNEDGRFLGSVVTKAPIRRAYHTSAGMVVETRQRRVTVHGVPEWWE